jgi:hypothetical protein
VNEMADERHAKGPSPNEPEAYLDDIDAMSLEELENQLPEAQDALDAIESKLEELMGLRDAALVCAAAMSARLAALKQADNRERDKEL